MDTNDIKIGETYRVVILGTETRRGRVASVTVVKAAPRGRFICRTHDTGRTVRAAAKRLRPVVAVA